MAVSIRRPRPPSNSAASWVKIAFHPTDGTVASAATWWPTRWKPSRRASSDGSP